MTKELSEMTNEELWQLFPIIITNYNPEWPRFYEEEKEVIERLVGLENIVRINHVGSTSIPGLVAKPTIDILLEIRENTEPDKLIGCLHENGYYYTPQPNKPAPQMMFMKGYTPEGFKGQAFHLHVPYPGDWDEIHFRNYLRFHPEEAEKYGELKLGLKGIYKNDRDAYTEAKTDFIIRINELARSGKQ